LVGDEQDAVGREALGDLGYGLFEHFRKEMGIDAADDDEIVGDVRVRKYINILSVAEVEVDAGGQIGGDGVGEVVHLALADVDSVDARATWEFPRQMLCDRAPATSQIQDSPELGLSIRR
jgi:hypothetical protein